MADTTNHTDTDPTALARRIVRALSAYSTEDSDDADFRDISLLWRRIVMREGGNPVEDDLMEMARTEWYPAHLADAELGLDGGDPQGGHRRPMTDGSASMWSVSSSVKPGSPRS